MMTLVIQETQYGVEARVLDKEQRDRDSNPYSAMKLTG